MVWSEGATFWPGFASLIMHDGDGEGGVQIFFTSPRTVLASYPEKR